MCGAGRESGRGRKSASPDPLQTLSAEALNQAAGDAAHFTFVDATREAVLPDADELQALLPTSGDAAACVLFFNPDDPLREAWRQLPAAVASLIQPPSDHFAVIVRKPVFDETGRFRDVSDPIWEWLIRVSQHGGVDVLDSGKNEGTHGQAALPALAPSHPGRALQWLRSAIAESDVGSAAVKAGLLQLNDYLDESHTLSQSVDGDRDGDYWHGIMHRREPDFSNSKYWFRRVGEHAVFSTLTERAEVILDRSPVGADWKDQLLGGGDWDPFAFVDMCEHCQRAADDDLSATAREIQFAEMLLLLAHCYSRAAT